MNTHFQFPAYYKMLRLQFGASNEEIKDKYKRMALSSHEDKGGSKELNYK